jgi:hypothetical protein
MNQQLVPLAKSQTLPAMVADAGEGAQICFLEFFAASSMTIAPPRAQ